MTTTFKYLRQGKRISLLQYQDETAELHFNNFEGINKFDHQTLQELKQYLEILYLHPPRGVLLTSGQTVFLAGGDITEFVKRFKKTESHIISALKDFNDALHALEGLPCPTVVAINGTALGGGIELALACDYRLARSSVRLGLPEVSLGIIPGTGGTVRLPRLIAPEKALGWICQGTIYNSEEAHSDKLIDQLSTNYVSLQETAHKQLHTLAQYTEHWKAIRQAKQVPRSSLPKSLLEDIRQTLCSQYHDETLNARLKAAEVIFHNIDKPYYEAFSIEAQAVAELGQSQASKQLVQAFINTRT